MDNIWYVYICISKSGEEHSAPPNSARAQTLRIVHVQISMFIICTCRNYTWKRPIQQWHTSDIFQWLSGHLCVELLLHVHSEESLIYTSKITHDHQGIGNSWSWIGAEHGFNWKYSWRQKVQHYFRNHCSNIHSLSLATFPANVFSTRLAALVASCG